MTRFTRACLIAMMMLKVVSCYVIHLEADINLATGELRNNHPARAIDSRFDPPPATVTITINNPTSLSTVKDIPTLPPTKTTTEIVIPTTSPTKESELSRTASSPGTTFQVDYAPCLHLYEPCTPSRNHCCTGSCQAYTQYASIGNFNVCMH